MSSQTALVLILSVFTMGYLFYALLRPEKF
jgi:K+-transporting ATPase KdpF subunit